MAHALCGFPHGGRKRTMREHRGTKVKPENVSLTYGHAVVSFSVIHHSAALAVLCSCSFAKTTAVTALCRCCILNEDDKCKRPKLHKHIERKCAQSIWQSTQTSVHRLKPTEKQAHWAEFAERMVLCWAGFLREKKSERNSS